MKRATYGTSVRVGIRLTFQPLDPAITSSCARQPVPLITPLPSGTGQ